MLRTWHQMHRESRRFGAIVADGISAMVGSWWFICFHAVWFSVWIGFKFEHYPFSLLTMIVSLEAIFLSAFILFSQNRQSERDRAHAEMDLKTDRESKLEIEALQIALDRIETEKLDKILDLLKK